MEALATGPGTKSALGHLAELVIIPVTVNSVVLKNVILFDNITWYQIIQYKWNKSFFFS